MNMMMTENVDTTRNVIEMITGGWRAQALYTAVKLKIPDCINRGDTTSEALAASSNSEVDGIHRLMRLLVSMGVFDGNEQKGYSNTAVGKSLLEGPNSLREMCLLYGEECYAAWGEAHNAIRTETSGFETAYGQSFYEYLGDNKDIARRFQKVMNTGNMFFHEVSNIYDFTGNKKVVDIGGGGGQLLAAILQAAPDSRGVLFDREHMIPTARMHIDNQIGLDRVEFVSGDMFYQLPEGGDAYIFSRVLAGWEDEAIVGVLTRCLSAMTNENARIILIDRLVNDKSPSMLPSLWDLQLLMTNGGRHRSLESFTSMLEQAGFEVEQVASLPMENTAIIAAPAGRQKHLRH